MEKYAEEHRFPIIGPAAGYACYQIARMINARSVFELGSGYGYSTAWFASAVEENGGGVVHHAVWDEDLSKMARGHLGRLGFEDMIQYHVAEAVATLRVTPGPFDLIFNDIEKAGLPGFASRHQEQAARRRRADHRQHALERAHLRSERARSKHRRRAQLHQPMITTDPDWIVSLLPIRDGLIVAMKTG